MTNMMLMTIRKVLELTQELCLRRLLPPLFLKTLPVLLPLQQSFLFVLRLGGEKIKINKSQVREATYCKPLTFSLLWIYPLDLPSNKQEKCTAFTLTLRSCKSN